jgi:hypothetical protein
MLQQHASAIRPHHVFSGVIVVLEKLAHPQVCTCGDKFAGIPILLALLKSKNQASSVLDCFRMADNTPGTCQ